jgi:hypothetical protein
LSPIRLRDYFLATLLGILPGAFAYTYLGDAVGDLLQGRLSINFWTALIVFTAAAALPSSSGSFQSPTRCDQAYPIHIFPEIPCVIQDNPFHFGFGRMTAGGARRTSFSWAGGTFIQRIFLPRKILFLTFQRQQEWIFQRLRDPTEETDAVRPID